MTQGPRIVVRMWEARVAPGRLDHAVRWLRTEVRRGALDSGALEASVFAARADHSAGQPDRVVLVTRWPTAVAWQMPADPTGAIVRAHAWDFEDMTGEDGSSTDTGD